MLQERLLDKTEEQFNSPIIHNESHDKAIELQYAADDINTLNDFQISGSSKLETITHPLSTSNISISLYILFILFGLGPSWVLLDAMFIELPYFQQYQPEKESLAAKMTVSGAMTLITALPAYFVFVNFIGTDNISFRKLMYVLIIAQIICCIIISLFWHYTIGDVSITIHLITYLCSFIGHLQTCAVIPYFTSINNKLSSAIVTGSNLGSLVTAFIGLIQKPGSKDVLFSPTIFYLIFITMFLLSLFVYIYLDYKYLRNIETITSHHRRLTNTSTKKPENRLISQLISTFSLPTWWRSICWFAILNAYIQLITWIFVRSTVPFAASHTASSTNNGTETEQYAIELSLVALLMGSALSLFIGINKNKYFVLIIIIYSIIALIFLIVVVDNSSGLWIFYGSNIFIVIIIFAMRFIDGYISPLIFKNVAALYPDKAHEMNQWIGGVEKISTFIGVWFTYFLVQTGIIHK